MLKLFDRNWLVIVMLLTVAALPVRTNAQAPTVVISEIAWAGSSSSASDEWIELTNVSGDTIDLSDWTLAGASSTGADLVLPDGSVVQPHSTYVISNYEYTHANTALAIASDFATATLSLPNGGFRLTLHDALGSIVDVAGGAGSPFAGRSGGTADADDGRYVSMVRSDGLGDGSLEESWADADASSGFKVGVEDLGTPGAVMFAPSRVIPSEVDSEVEGSPSEEVEEVDPGFPAPRSFSEGGSLGESGEPSTPTIVINEFVVDPNEGDNEWIELVNPGLESIDLTGWSLEDATGKQTLLEGTLAPGEYRLVTAPLGKLNNDEDSILLKDENGTLVDAIEYGTDELAAPKDGAALARGTSGSFELTYATTPGAVNVIDPEKPVEEEVDPGFPARHSSQSDGGSLGESEEAENVTQEETIETEPTIEEPAADESVESVLSDLSETSYDIRLNEFVVDPDGDGVEWIELFNAGGTNVTLEGWTIEDASGKTTDLSTVTIEADGYAVIESPKGKLNNDADSVILKDASRTMVESVVYGGDSYPVPKDGEALARNGGTFEITELTTPGSPNFIFVALEEIVEVEEAEEVDPDFPAPRSFSEGGSLGESEEADLLKTLRFVTLYPNASGSDEEEEYIVIENTGSEAIDLVGWSIEDGSTKTFTFEDSTTLAAGATIQVGRPQSKLTLNNGGDTLELTAPDGDVVDLVTYGTSAKGATFDLVDESWKWSGTATVTEPAAATTTSVPAAVSTTNVSTSTNATSASATASARVAQSVTIAQAKEKADGQSVIVKGVVTSAPGTFGSQVFYLQDETGGVQVYLYSGDFPELALGDVIQVTGEISANRGERRVKLSSAANVVPARGTFESEAIDLAIDELEDSLVGLLLKIRGQIQSIDTNKLVIEHAGATVMVYLKSTPLIDAQQFERGDKIDVTGVLTSYDGELRLRPRSVGDITVVEEAPVAGAVTTESSGGSSAGMILLFTTMAALVALALWRYLPRRRLTPAAA